MSVKTKQGDKLIVPITFIAGTKDKEIKIPAVKRGEKWLDAPNKAVFKNYKYKCTSAYVASVLRKECSPEGILELKG